jgi:hypothetical protein
MGKNFDLRPYSINDFREWNERGELVLSPKFQRRRVWSDKAKSCLIDTILRGLPMPPVFIRQHIDIKTRKTVREVIDGQQRLGAILDFLRGGFKVSKIHNEDYGNLYFSELSPDIQDDFLQYVIATNLVLNPKDEQVLGIFARLNTYTVTLNKQELWNAKYFGLFKQTVHNLAYEFYTFWTNSNILTERKIARMGDVELTSELVIVMIDGIQDKKIIENYYKKYDDEFPDRNRIVKEFKKCIDTIGEIYGDTLPSSYLNGAPLFYSLFCVIYELLFGLKSSSYKERVSINQSHYPRIKNALEELESILQESFTESGRLKSGVPDNIRQFIEDYTRHTTVLQVRKRRHDFLLKFIFEYLREKK